MTPTPTALAPIRFAPPSSGQLLARVLDDRALVAQVQALAPQTLARLIDHVGLEDAGELIALATTEQLVEVFDVDLWREAAPGEDERFDAARFVLWLEIMLEAGAGFTARRLAELPEDLIVHALHQHVLVVDLDALGYELADADQADIDLLDKAMDSSLCHELDGFRLLARRHDGWDAIVTALTELDVSHHATLARWLERMVELSATVIDDGGGLYEVLTSEDMLAVDVAAEREDRRARDGFVAPSSARAFLRLATATDLPTARTQGRDAVTRAYFRELTPRPATDGAEPRLAQLLRDAGILDEPGAAPTTRRLTAGPAPASDAVFRDAVTALLAVDPALHAQRLAELGFLANVLVAGADAGGGRRFRPAEAAAAAVTTCGLGLVHLLAATAELAVAVVAREPADTLFRLGWRLLHERTGDPARALLGGQAVDA